MVTVLQTISRDTKKRQGQTTPKNTPSGPKLPCNQDPQMAGHGWQWPTMASHGLPWPAMADHGLPWPAMPCHFATLSRACKLHCEQTGFATALTNNVFTRPTAGCRRLRRPKKAFRPKKMKTFFGIFEVLAPRGCEKHQQVGDLSMCTSILSFGNQILRTTFAKHCL